MVQGLRIWLQGTHVQSLVKELRSTCTAATKPTHLEPVLHSKRSRCGEKPAHRDEDSGPARHKWRVAPPITSGERPPLTATGESRSVRSPRTMMKTAAPPITSGEWPLLTATGESRGSEKPTHCNEESGPRSSSLEWPRLTATGESPPSSKGPALPKINLKKKVIQVKFSEIIMSHK